MQAGIVYAVLAYASWGLFPLYMHALADVAPTEILIHRMLWSMLFLGIVLSVRRQWSWLGQVWHQPRLLLGFCASATILAFNWLTFIWAINNGHVVDSSLGYFINPLVNVLLGCLLLKERLRAMQWGAIALAALGVAWLTWQAGQPPWIGLVLALTFASYGLLRKTARLGAIEGLALETLLLLPFALAYFVWLVSQDASRFVSGPTSTQLLLMCAGPITSIPLIWFAAGARRLPFSLLGLLQYIGPSLQLGLGIWVFHEAFEPAKLAGYAVIWLALALYSAESLWTARLARRTAQPA